MKKTILTLIATSIMIVPAYSNSNTNLWKYVNLDITPTNDMDYAAIRLKEQDLLILYLEDESFPGEFAELATNLWARLSVLHGDLREKKSDVLPQQYRNFGIVASQSELQERMAANSNANRICRYQSRLNDVEKRIEIVLSHVAASEALASFPLDERNAIVSNIVETARLTAEESAALGLTNIVEQTGEP